MKHPLPNAIALSCQRVAGIALLLLLGLEQPVWAALDYSAGNGTVRDTTTGLVWDRCSYGQTGASCTTGTALQGTWAQALGAAVAANATSYKGFNDWRVPNRNELESIVNIGSFNPAIDTTAFLGMPSGFFWTSATYAPDPSGAWFVEFSYGRTDAAFKTVSNYVRLVRSGQSLASFDALAQTITFANPGTKTLGTSPTLTATATSGLTPTFTSTTTGVCTITSGGTLTFVTVGTCTINANQAGNGSYSAAPQVSQSFAVNQAGQTITGFSPASPVVFGAAPATLSATGGASGNPVVFATTSANTICTVSGSTVTFTGAGTCNLTANQAGNASYGAAAQATASIVIAQASQTIVFGAAPTVEKGRVGVVTTTGGASGNPRVYASSTPAACTVDSSLGIVTGVVVGTNNCTITANQAGNANYAAAAQASQTFSIVTPLQPPPSTTIPPLGNKISGMSRLPAILNMAAGAGPAFMDDLVAMLSRAVGQTLRLVGQNAQGSVALSGYKGGNLVFVPHSFQSVDGRANGVYPMGDGQYQVVRNGQSLVIAPTVVQLDQLTAILPRVSASQGDNGVITAAFEGQTYVVQAGVAAQLDPASGSARLVLGSDGFFRFIDALGNNQILYPAFKEPGTLRTIMQGQDAKASLDIALDGTAVMVLNGQRYTLVPDLTLGEVPTDRLGQSWWQEGAVRFRFVNTQVPFGTLSSQGYTVMP